MRRRRAFTALGAVVLVAAGVAACTTITSGNGHHHDSTTSSSNGGASTTVHPRPHKPSSYNVGIQTVTWTDESRDTPNPATGVDAKGRVLKTEIRYPTVKGSRSAENPGAAPAAGDGPFPVILFAHGFDTMPDTYAPLLDAWVHAGFIVVAPVFPDENADTVATYGGPTGAGGNGERDDETNEAADIAFVLKQFDSSNLAHVAKLDDVALAGQSDGANVVAALAFGSAYKMIWASISPAPKAVAVLSGEGALTDGPGNTGTNTFSSSPTSPALLQVQSIADSCNLGPQAADLYAAIDTGPVHLFQTLTQASHLDPYVGIAPWSTIVESVTTKFFELELGWRTTGLSLASIQTAGTVANESSMTPPNATTFANSPTTQVCTFPPGVSPTGTTSATATTATTTASSGT